LWVSWKSVNWKSYFASRAYIIFAHIFSIFCPIYTKISIGDVHKNVLHNFKFLESQHTESCNLLRSVSQFRSILYTFIVQFWWNWVRDTHVTLLSVYELCKTWFMESFTFLMSINEVTRVCVCTVKVCDILGVKNA